MKGVNWLVVRGELKIVVRREKPRADVGWLGQLMYWPSLPCGENPAGSWESQRHKTQLHQPAVPCQRACSGCKLLSEETSIATLNGEEVAKVSGLTLCPLVASHRQ